MRACMPIRSYSTAGTLCRTAGVGGSSNYMYGRNLGGQWGGAIVAGRSREQGPTDVMTWASGESKSRVTRRMVPIFQERPKLRSFAQIAGAGYVPAQQ